MHLPGPHDYLAFVRLAYLAAAVLLGGLTVQSLWAARAARKKAEGSR